MPESLLQKTTLAQVFSCKFGDIFNNTFFADYLWWLPLQTDTELIYFNITEYFLEVYTNYNPSQNYTPSLNF